MTTFDERLSAPSPPHQARPRIRDLWSSRLVRRSAHVVFWTGVATLAARFTLDTWSRLNPDQLRITAAGVAVTGVLLLAARATDVLGWFRLVRGAGGSPSLSSTARVYTTAELVRYLPGGVLHFAARYRYAKQLGITPATMVATTAIDLALRLATGLVLFGLTLPLWPDLPRSYLVLTIATLPALVVCSHPSVLGALIAKVQRKLGKGAEPLVLPYRVLVQAAVWNIVGWLARGAATWLIARSLADVSSSTIIPIVGATTLSWAVGVLTPVAPGGLGAREAAGTALLVQFVPFDVAFTIMLIVRLATTLTELAAAGLVVVGDRVMSGARTPMDSVVSPDAHALETRPTPAALVAPIEPLMPLEPVMASTAAPAEQPRPHTLAG